MIHRTSTAALSLLALLAVSVAIAVGCSGGGGDDDDDDDGNPDATCTPILDVTLTSVQSVIFTPRCAISQCHDSAGAALSGGLNLSAGQSRAETVGIPAVGTFNGNSMVLVSAGNANASYLYKKVTGENGIDGFQMPQGLPELCAEKQDAIADWIDAGALNN